MISDVQMVTMVIRDKVDANLVCVQVVMEAECNTPTRAVWIRAPTFRVLSVTAGGATLVSRVSSKHFSAVKNLGYRIQIIARPVKHIH